MADLLRGRCTRRELGLLVAGFVLWRRGVARAEGPRLGELLAHCDGCVVGQAVSASSGWVRLGGKRRIATTHRFVVERALDGSAAAGEVLQVRTLGGTVGDYAQRVLGEAVIPVGTPMLLLLTRAEPGVFVVTGMEHGRFGLQPDAAGVLRVRARYAIEDAAGPAAQLEGASVDQAEEILAEASWEQDAR